MKRAHGGTFVETLDVDSPSNPVHESFLTEIYRGLK